MQDIARTIIEAGILAPSGENAQPWFFRVRSSDPVLVEVSIKKERDHSPYGWGSRASLVAIGAALENMKIRARSLGLLPNIDFNTSNNVVAVFSAKRTGNSMELGLANAIEKRSTNRKQYQKKPIAEDVLERIKSSLVKTEDVHCIFKRDKESIRRAVLAGCANEAIMLSNKVLHEYFFSHVNWSKQQDEDRKLGFYIPTLELPASAVLGFRIMSSWSRALFMNKYFAMNKIVQNQNAAVFGDVPVLGLIHCKDDSRQSAIAAGMAIERVWLTATQEELSIQPIAGILYLNLGAIRNELQGFNKQELKTIYDANEQIKLSFGLTSEVPFFMFRIGYSDKPSARSSRFNFEDVVEYA